MGVIAVGLVACGGGSGAGSNSGTATTINGIAVPPAPDAAANNATLAGVDSNGNGVRDDVERVLATKFGGTGGKYAEAVNHVKSEQSLITSQNNEAVDHYIQTVACSTLSVDESDALTYIQLNTKERRVAYAQKLAGKVSKGCKQ